MNLIRLIESGYSGGRPASGLDSGRELGQCLIDLSSRRKRICSVRIVHGKLDIGVR